MGGACCNNFDAFFESGHATRFSPFLRRSSRLWGINLPLKASFHAAGCLLAGFALSYLPEHQSLAHLLLLLTYLLAGIPSLIDAIEDLLDLDINIDILMTLAAFSSVAIGNGFEGGLLLVLFNLSGAMEHTVTSKALGALRNLHKLAPSKATVVSPEGKLLERSVKDIKVGTHILVRAGDIVPLDGEVIEGSSGVNLVHLTGEATPITKTVGDTVPAGGTCIDGALTIKVTLPSSDSTLAKIISLITEAQEAKPRLAQFFSAWSRRYALSIISLSALFALIFPFLLHIPFLGPTGSLYRALAFLIAASPCALILAIPITYLSAISSCARNGILLKGGVTLDAISSCQLIAFDKTGTLTTGKLKCIEMEGLTELPEDALSIAYGLERGAHHPVAEAIGKYAEEQGVRPAKIEHFKALAGFGLQGALEGTEVAIGRVEWIQEQLPAPLADSLAQKAKEIREEGEVLSVLRIGEQVILFHFEDEIRQEIQKTLEELKKQQYQLVMLTGDHKANAKRVASALQIDRVHADLHPEDKLNYVTDLSRKQGLAMIGDGINDAPALARSTVGIAMGGVGSQTAIEAADAVLLHDNIERLDWLMNKAKMTKKIATQNLIFASLAIIGASLPALGGFIPLWLAVILHEGGTVLVGLNGLRLLPR